MIFVFIKIFTKTITFVKMSSNIRTRSKSNNILDSEQTSKYFNKPSNDLSEEKTHEVRKKRKIVKNNETSEATAKEPQNWKIILENIRKMRSDKNAVVDTKGCEKTCDKNEDNPKTKRFQVLISLMLSSQTRDEITHKTMQSLIEYGLTIDHIIDTPDHKLRELISSVSFFNNKTKFIKKTALILRDQYDGDIPDSVEALIKLPGVGPKMAHLAMLIGWDKCTGIAVDTHVHRICNRLEWVKSKTPEQTQKQLEIWLPKTEWTDINLMLVGFGQTICSPIKPKCGKCLNQKVCPFASKNNFDF